MKNKKYKTKNLLLISVAVFIFLAFMGVYGVKLIKADEADNYPPIVQKLVDRFGLNENEVKQVFDETRQEKHEQMQARFEDRLNKAVEEAKITQEQKQLILDKKAEMQANPKEHKGEMKTWLEEQGIDLKELFPMGTKGGFKKHFGPKL